MASQSDSATTFKRIFPSEFYDRFLDEGVRPDGRECQEFRPTRVNIDSINTADGSSVVTIGATSVVCGVKAEFANPPLDGEGDQGWLACNVSLPPMCSPLIRPGPPCAEAQSLSVFLQDLVIKSKIVDLKDLIIIKGMLSWVLHVDVYCLNLDGNITDAAVLAVTSALRSTKIPRVNTETAEGGLPTVNRKQRTPLKVNCSLFSTTSCWIGARSHLVADATAEEETMMTSSVTVVMDDKGCVRAMQQPAPHSVIANVHDVIGISPAARQSIMQSARARAETLDELVDSVFEAQR